MKKPIKLTPLGGLGEIGMNMLIIEFGKDAIIVDCGVMFADSNFPGVNLLIPNFEYLRQHKLNVRAVILTHGHEDHLGALPFLLHEFKWPVYGSRFTTELLKIKLQEFALADSVSLTTIRDGDQINLGPFDVEFIRMSHSISDATGLAIRTPLGLIVHTGDFKIDPHPADGRTTDMARFEKFGEEGVLLLLSDSTNVEVPGHSISESSVKTGIEEIMKATKGWFVLSSFASHIPRIQQVFELAMLNRRKVCIAGRTMIQNVGLAKKLGYLEFPDRLLLEFNEVRRVPRDKVTILSTGSQGEMRSALAKMALGEHKDLELEDGDAVVLSSRFIPGNEKSIYYIINQLYRRGAEVFTSTGSDIHVSGHAYREDLRQMILATRPRFFIPIHGEYRHLAIHADLARESGVKPRNALLIENGEPAVLFESHIEKGNPVNVTKVAVDGLNYISIDSEVMKDRRKLAETGVLSVALTLDKDSAEILKKPVFKARGICSEAQMQELLPELRHQVVKTVEKVTRHPRFAFEELEEQVRLSARRFILDELQKKPIVVPIIMQV